MEQKNSLSDKLLDIDRNYMNGHAQELINREIKKLRPERIKRLKENLDEAIRLQNCKSIFHIVTDLVELLEEGNDWYKEDDDHKYYHLRYHFLDEYKGLLRGCIIYSLEREDVNLATEICNYLKRKDYDSQFINNVLSSIEQKEKNKIIYHQILEAAKNNRWNVAQKLIAQIKERAPYFAKKEVPNSIIGSKVTNENSFFLVTAFEKNIVSPILGVQFISNDQVVFFSEANGYIWDFLENKILQELKSKNSYTHPKPIFDVANDSNNLVFAEWDMQHEEQTYGGFRYHLAIKSTQKNEDVSYLHFPDNTSIHCFKYSSQNNYLFGGVRQGDFIEFSDDIWVWRADSKEVVEKLMGHVDMITTLEYISDTDYLTE